jgi:hypothetical protein
MKEKFTLPKLSKAEKGWFIHFRYEGKQYRFKEGLNYIKNLKEREIEFNALGFKLREKLMHGWYPNKVEKKKVLSFDMFSKQEKTNFLNELMNNNLNSKVIKKIKTTPKHENIFCNNGLELFEAFAKLHIIDKYIDFSFLFQQMKFNGYILDIKHVKFMDWLLENEYINPKEHETFLIEKSFRSLKKCAFGTRVDLYLKLKNGIIPVSSDLSE